MIDTTAGLRFIVSDFLSGDASLEDVDHAVAGLGESIADEPEAIRRVWAELELALAEFSQGHLDDAELRWELVRAVPVGIDVGPRRVVRSATGTAARSFTNWVAGLIGESPSPAADTRDVAARA